MVASYVPPPAATPAGDETPARRCAASGCSRPVPKATTGRPGLYCSEVCRKAAYRAREQQKTAEAARLAAQRRREEAERQRCVTAVALVDMCARAPGFYAGAVVDWIGRHDNRPYAYNDREEAVNSLVIFLSRLDPKPALPFLVPAQSSPGETKPSRARPAEPATAPTTRGGTKAPAPATVENQGGGKRRGR